MSSRPMATALNAALRSAPSASPSSGLALKPLSVMTHSCNPQQIKNLEVRWGHTVRLIALEDLPHGKAYKDEVVRVKAGYARNYLIPQKKALYATPHNFHRLGLVDPALEEPAATEKPTSGELGDLDQELEELYLKEADTLKHYLRNKVVSLLLCSAS